MIPFVVLAAFSLFGLLFALIDYVECAFTGMLKLYRRYSHDSSDRIFSHYTTFRSELNIFLHWRLLRIGIGEKCIHLSFFAIPILFRRPIAIPWSEVEIEGSLEDSLLPFFRTAEFRFGPDRFFLRLRGRAARAVQERFYALAKAT